MDELPRNVTPREGKYYSMALEVCGLRANGSIAPSGDANGNNRQLTLARVCHQSNPAKMRPKATVAARCGTVKSDLATMILSMIYSHLNVYLRGARCKSQNGV